MPTPDHYETLQITPSASPEEIKQAFRVLARQYHPDLNPRNPQAAEIFRQIREAYDILSDPIRRYYYDRKHYPRRTPSTATVDKTHNFYIQGIESELARDYRGALEAYSQAIEHRPSFVEALLRRCGVRYVLEQDRLVLEDCSCLLALEDAHPQLSAHAQAQVYYYQGLARARSGYTQSAVEAFSQAIAQEPDHGQAHYHLGLAHLELQEMAEGMTGLERALALFQEQGDGQGYQQVLETLNQSQLLSKSRLKSQPQTALREKLLTVLGLAFRSLPGVLLDPSGSLLSTYGRLQPTQATQVGVLWLLLALLCSALAATIRWPQGFQTFGLSLLAVAIMAILGLLLGLSFTRGLRLNNWSRLFFVAGAALLPFSLLLILLALVGTQTLFITVSLLVLFGCYGVLILFSGLTQVLNVPESRAAIAVPLLLLLTGWLTYWTFISLIPRPALDSIQII